MSPWLFPALLSHHHEHELERCVFFGPWALCRRCLALYPATGLMIWLALGPRALPPAWQPWLMGLAVPATAEFVLERLGRIQYSARRVVWTSLLLAVPLGSGFADYLRNPLEPRWWGFVLAFGIPAGLAALWRGWQDHGKG